MKTLKEFIFERQLTEIFNSNFEVNNDTEISSAINHGLGNKIYPGHTAVLHSDHMKSNGHSILRLMNKNKEVEYHFLNHDGEFKDHKLDNKSMLHAMKIIHDDASDYINKGHNIKLQSANDLQHEKYKTLANRLITKLKVDKKITTGNTERLDGTGFSKTVMIEEIIPGCSNFSGYLKDT